MKRCLSWMNRQEDYEVSHEMFLLLAVVPQVWIFYVIFFFPCLYKSQMSGLKCIGIWTGLFDITKIPNIKHNNNNNKKVLVLIWSPEAFSRHLPIWVPNSTRHDWKQIDLAKYLRKQNISLKGYSAFAARKKQSHWR